jgi:branched-chain amino acid transport system substrate-binding protein
MSKLRLKLVSIVVVITLLVGVVAILSACKPQVIVETVTVPGETVVITEIVEKEVAATAAPMDHWEIPFLDVMTGGFAAAGVPGAWAIKEAEKDINAAGGIAGKPVDFVLYDTGSTTSVARVAIEKALARNPIYVVSYDAGESAEATLTMTSLEQVFTLCSVAGADTTELYLPWNTGWANYMDNSAGAVELEWVKAHPEIKKVVPLYDSTNVTYKNESDSTMKWLTEYGIEVLEPVTFEQFTQVDYGPVAVEALSRGADGYYFSSFGTPYAKTVIEMAKRGMTETWRFIGNTGTDYPELYALGGDYIEGCYIASSYDESDPTPEWQSILERYRAMTADQGQLFVWMAYQNAIWVKRAIEETGVTGDPAKLEKERLMLAEWSYNRPDYQFFGFKADIVSGFGMLPYFLNVIEGGKKKLIQIVPTRQDIPQRIIDKGGAPKLPPIPE